MLKIEVNNESVEVSREGTTRDVCAETISAVLTVCDSIAEGNEMLFDRLVAVIADALKEMKYADFNKGVARKAGDTDEKE